MKKYTTEEKLDYYTKLMWYHEQELTRAINRIDDLLKLRENEKALSPVRTPTRDAVETAVKALEERGPQKRYYRPKSWQRYYRK